MQTLQSRMYGMTAQGYTSGGLEGGYLAQLRSQNELFGTASPRSILSRDVSGIDASLAMRGASVAADERLVGRSMQDLLLGGDRNRVLENLQMERELRR